MNAAQAALPTGGSSTNVNAAWSSGAQAAILGPSSYNIRGGNMQVAMAAGGGGGGNRAFIKEGIEATRAASRVTTLRIDNAPGANVVIRASLCQDEFTMTNEDALIEGLHRQLEATKEPLQKAWDSSGLPTRTSRRP